MEFDRLNPVTLIAGIACGVGAAAARALALPSEGGLILADRDERALSAVADTLEEMRVAPERLSTLAFDLADAERWAQAMEFVRGQYGRLDCAVIASADVEPTSAAPGELVDWGRRPEDLQATQTAFDAISSLIRGNYQGGAIVVAAPASSIVLHEPQAGLLGLLHANAEVTAADAIRLNAVATDGANLPFWDGLPWFADILGAGSAETALTYISAMQPPLARYPSSADRVQLFRMLLSYGAGAALVVDGS